MKVQFRSILFALVVPVAACGGDREPQAVRAQSNPFSWEPKTHAPVTAPDLDRFTLPELRDPELALLTPVLNTAPTAVLGASPL